VELLNPLDELEEALEQVSMQTSDLFTTTARETKITRKKIFFPLSVFLFLLD
jgi:hypothetical protein